MGDWYGVMKDDQHRFLLLLGQLPVRLTAEQAGWVLNCQAHDISGGVAPGYYGSGRWPARAAKVVHLFQRGFELVTLPEFSL